MFVGSNETLWAAILRDDHRQGEKRFVPGTGAQDTVSKINPFFDTFCVTVSRGQISPGATRRIPSPFPLLPRSRDADQSAQGISRTASTATTVKHTIRSNTNKTTSTNSIATTTTTTKAQHPDQVKTRCFHILVCHVFIFLEN
jgi:hypothetical protein